MGEKLWVKRKHIYRLHRDKEKDHELGRPALLLNGRITKSLIWAGTTKFDEHNTEVPLTLDINDTPVYFYGNAIETVATKDLKTEWIDNKTKKPYVISPDQQEAVLKKIIDMSHLKNPFLKIKQLETSNEAIKIKLSKAKYINYKLLQENEILKTENEKLSLENKTLNHEKELLKNNNKIKEILEYEQE